MVRISQIALGDQFSTVIDLGVHGRVSGFFFPTRPEATAIEAFTNGTTLPDEVARHLIAWPIEGTWEEAAAFVTALVQGGHTSATAAAVATLFGFEPEVE